MNLWDKGKVLIVLMILSILYSSCEEDDNTIGFPVDKNLNVDYFEYDIPVEMLWVDSVLSQHIGIIYSGQFDFDEAGDVKMVPFVSYTAQNYGSNIDVPHNALFKDFYLNLDYTAAISGDADAAISLDIFRITDTIPGNKNNFIEDKMEPGELIGQKSFTFFPDTLRAEQTSDTVKYSERIELKDSLGQFYLNRLREKDLSVFKNFNTFDTSFKGIAIVPSADNPAILGFSPASSTIVIEYTYIDENGIQKEGSFSFRPAKYFHNVTPNKNDADLADAAFSGISCCYEPFTPPGEFVYHLFGTGINIALDLSAFKMFADSLKNPILNSAAIVLDDVTATSENAGPPNEISFYFIDEEGSRITKEFANQDFYMTLPANEIHLDPVRVGNPARAIFDKVQNNYTVNVTLYLQELIDDSSTPARLLIESSTLASFGNSPFSFLRRASRTVTGIQIPKQSIRLKVYYSKIK